MFARKFESELTVERAIFLGAVMASVFCVKKSY